MTIDIKKSPEFTVIEIAGRLDTTTAPALDKVINEEIQPETNIVFDLNQLIYISSAGLRVLLNAQKKLQKLGSMKLKGVCEDVMEVFEMTGFTEVFTIE